MTRSTGWKAIRLAALLVCVACVMAGCRSARTPSLADRIPETLLEAAETRCGQQSVLRGDRIRLAANLDAALVRLRPVRLTATQARWLLGAGWDFAASDASTGPIERSRVRAQEPRATIHMPALPCGEKAGAAARVILALSRATLQQGAAISPVSLRIEGTGRSLAGERIDDEDAALIEIEGARRGECEFVDLSADPAGLVMLDGLALAIGRERVEINKEYRDAILASSVREASFRVLPPRGAVLRFALAVAPGSGDAAAPSPHAAAPAGKEQAAEGELRAAPSLAGAPRDADATREAKKRDGGSDPSPSNRGGQSSGGRAIGAAQALDHAAPGGWFFRIGARGDKGEREFAETIAAPGDPEAGRWHERSFDLAEFEGQEITLTLSAEPGDGAPPLAMWGTPTIEARAEAGHQPPNILLISMDTLRADEISRVVNQRSVMPELEILAGEGVRFTSCRTQAPSTLYGHVSILTGLPPSAHGTTTQVSLPEGVPYASDLLQQAGYVTVAIADAGLLDGRFGLTRGFDVFHNRYEGIDSKIESALKVLGSLPRPWFVFLHSYEVHIPYSPPLDLAKAFSPDYSGPLGFSMSAARMQQINNNVYPVDGAGLEQIRKLYDSEAAHGDAALGRLFTGMKEAGLWDPTAVIVTSDHGEEFDEHGVIGWHALTCYDELQRTPLIVKPARGARFGTGSRSGSVAGAGSGLGPGSGSGSGAGAGSGSVSGSNSVNAGQSPRLVATAVRSMDIAPTILHLAGAPVPEAMWGRSLAPLMSGGAEVDRETLCEIEDGRGASILAGGWKYHMRTADSVDDPRTFRRRVSLRGRYSEEELYDLAKDPGEQRNLAASDPNRARAFADLLAARLAAARAALSAMTAGRTPPQRPREDDEHLRQLKALGYVQ